MCPGRLMQGSRDGCGVQRRRRQAPIQVTHAGLPCGAGARLGDDEQGEVQAVHEQVGDGGAHVRLGALLVARDQDHL